MRILRQWLFGERAIRGGGAIELDIVERQIDRETAAVSAEAGAAAGLERRLQGVRDELARDLADGVVDLNEARRLARKLNGTAMEAHLHTQKLEALT